MDTMEIPVITVCLLAVAVGPTVCREALGRLLRNHGVQPDETDAVSMSAAGRPVRHISAKQPGIGAGPPRRAASFRYADGDRPTSSENRRLNVPTLEKPTS